MKGEVAHCGTPGAPAVAGADATEGAVFAALGARLPIMVCVAPAGTPLPINRTAASSSAIDAELAARDRWPLVRAANTSFASPFKRSQL
jgi:hypothetical protein